MALMGISSLGVRFLWAAETTAGTKPAGSSFDYLTRISSIGEINLEVESIDVSALEDFVTAYTEGRADTGGTCEVVVNMTDDTITEWENVIEEYADASADNKEIWFEVYHPKLTKAFFFKAGLPSKINMPAQDQNVAETFTVSLVVHDYVGLDTAAIPTTSGGGDGVG